MKGIIIDMSRERKITINSKSNGFWSNPPTCDIYLDDYKIGKLSLKSSFTFPVDNKVHKVFCGYKYGKQEKDYEISNTFTLKSGLDYVLNLQCVAKTMGEYYCESFSAVFTKGYLPVREIELVEDEKQAEVNKKILQQSSKTINKKNKTENESVDLWSEMIKY